MSAPIKKIFAAKTAQKSGDPLLQFSFLPLGPTFPLRRGILLPQCWFDDERCGRSLEALRFYRCEYSDKFQTYTARPVHDWSSHAADAFRYLAIEFGRQRRRPPRDTYRPTTADNKYDVMAW